MITFNSAPDYETKTSYSVTVNVSDGTNTTSQALAIAITNIDESSWTQRGSDIDGEAAGDISGYGVSISNEGNTVAIGAWLNGGNGEASGHSSMPTWMLFS